MSKIQGYAYADERSRQAPIKRLVCLALVTASLAGLSGCATQTNVTVPVAATIVAPVPSPIATPSPVATQNAMPTIASPAAHGQAPVARATIPPAPPPVIARAPQPPITTSAIPSAAPPKKERTSPPLGRLTDAQIAEILVKSSRANYLASGHRCPCPDDTYASSKGAHRCGEISAHSRPGGQRPYCSFADVPATLIAATRKRLLAQ